MIGPLVLLIPWLVNTPPPITVRGNTDCPLPEAVIASLTEMMIPAPNTSDEVAEIENAGADLAITIRDRDGSLLLTRRLPRTDLSPPACAALAEAAAVVIATWQIEQHAELSLSQPGVHPPPPATTELVMPTPPTLESVPMGTEIFLGGALGTTVSQAGLIATVQANVGLRRRADRVGLWLALAVDGQRKVTQSGGTSAWRRMTAGLGPCLALGRGLVVAELGAQLFLGRTSVEGTGFAVDGNDDALSLGIEALLRLVGSGSVQPFLEGSVRAWFAPQEIEVLDSAQADSHASLPRVEGRLTAGLRVRLGT